MTEKQLLELLEKYVPAIRDAIIAGIRDIRDNARLSEIIRMIELNNVEGALRALGYNPSVFNQYYMTLTQAFNQGGLTMIAGLPKYTDDGTGVSTILRFNVRDPAAERWLTEQSSKLITSLEDDLRLVTRSVLADGLREGRNPRNVALDLVGRIDRSTGHRTGGAIGLGERELMWTNSVRQKLVSLDPSYLEMTLRDKRFDDIVREAIATGKPLTAAQVGKLVDRYRDNALRHRGETIGRTEALAALNRSEWESTRQALEQSGLPVAAASKIWDSAGDSRVRNSHRKMDGQRVGIDEPFVTPNGSRLMHPHDASLGAPGSEIIACRCRVRYDIDFAYGVE